MNFVTRQRIHDETQLEYDESKLTRRHLLQELEIRRPFKQGKYLRGYIVCLS